MSEAPEHTIDAVDVPDDPIGTLRGNPDRSMFAVRMMSFDTGTEPEPIWYVFASEGNPPPSYDMDFSIIGDWEILYRIRRQSVGQSYIEQQREV